MSLPLPGSGVRPTRSCLDDLSIPVPNLGVPLEGLDHDLVVKAQRLPEQMSAGGAERILSLDDRIWFKVKTEAWRGAACRSPLENTAVPPDVGEWWLGAAGTRRADSAQDDFYDRLAADCRARRKLINEAGGQPLTSDVSTAHLLPCEWDRDRLVAEIAERARFELQRRSSSTFAAGGSAYWSEPTTGTRRTSRSRPPDWPTRPLSRSC